MSGIDRLRTLAGAWDEWGLGGTLAEIADQIERELREERDRWDSELCEAQMDKSRVTAVYLEMNKHVLGHEGMEDSPVARWARELREALGGAVTDEDREAAEWVRKRGGIDYVKGEWRSRVPYDRYERRRQRLLGHIAECETALGRRNERIDELGRRINDLTNENAELRRRAMPESCKWPRFEDGELVNLGDRYECWCGKTHVVSSVAIMEGRSVLNASDNAHTFVVSDGPFTAHGKRVKRPSVLAADGEPLEVGQTVWWLKNPTCHLTVDRVDSAECVSVTDRFDGEAQGLSGIPAKELTHQRPVLDADGVPIKKGDTVYLLPGKWCDVFPCFGFHGGEELEVFADGEASHVPGGVQCRETEKSLGSRGTCYPQPSQLTHTKPEIDTWERIEEDASLSANDYRERYGMEKRDGMTWPQQIREDLVRRCRALAERERGE